MAAPRGTITPVEPRFVLNLDDLPKVIEADGIVWPVYLTLRDCSRLFCVAPSTLRRWMQEYNFPCLIPGNAPTGSVFIEVAALNNWLIEHSRPIDEAYTVTDEHDVFETMDTYADD